MNVTEVVQVECCVKVVTELQSKKMKTRTLCHRHGLTLMVTYDRSQSGYPGKTRTDLSLHSTLVRYGPEESTGEMYQSVN